MFKYFTELGEEGTKVSIAINTSQIFCALDGPEPNTTILRLENGGWFTVEGSLLQNVARLNEE